MATADTQSAKPRSSRRRLHNPQVENDFAPGDGEPPARPPPLQRSQSHRERPTKQLDFYQAMSDFKVNNFDLKYFPTGVGIGKISVLLIYCEILVYSTIRLVW
jgi:hypothetical protein